MTESTSIILHAESERRRAREARREAMRGKPQAAPTRLCKPSSLATPRFEYCGKCRLLVIEGQGCAACALEANQQAEQAAAARLYPSSQPVQKVRDRRGLHPITAVALVILMLLVGGAVLQQSVQQHVMETAQ